MILPENKTIVLEDGSEYFVLKNTKFKRRNYAVVLSIDNAMFSIMQVKTNSVVLVESERLVSAIMDNLISDPSFVEAFNSNLDKILKAKK